MGKQRTIKYDNDAREKMLAGVSELAKAVKTTLGPSGTNVYIRNQSEQLPFVTKDGVTVAGQIYCDDPIGMMAIESMKNIATLSDHMAGDGTTTATIIGEAIFNQGIKAQRENPDLNLINLSRGIEHAKNIVVEKIKEAAVSVKDDHDLLKEVALVSSNNDPVIARMVLDAYKKAGKDGVVNIKRSRTYESYISVIDGMTIDVGFRSVYYINDHENKAFNADKVWVLATNKKITSMSKNLEHLCVNIAERGEALVIMCPGMTENVSDVLIRQATTNGFRGCVIGAPGFGEEQTQQIKDLGTFLGGQVFIEHEMDFDSVGTDQIFDILPRCKEVLVQDQYTAFKGPWYDIEDAEDRKRVEDLIQTNRKLVCDEIRKELARKHHNEYERNFMNMRISKLSEGLCYINIGASSDSEYIDIQHRLQDALYAVKAAAEEGIIPGGGTALLSISGFLKPEGVDRSFDKGIEILQKAICEPFKTVYENVNGESPKYVVRKYFFGLVKRKAVRQEYLLSQKHFNYGFEGRSNKFVENMFHVGIVDAAKVTRVAVENAVSIISGMLTTKVTVVDHNIYEQNGYAL